MRVLLSSLLTLGIPAMAHATHIIGGEIYYDHLGGDQYQVSLKLYRDCGPGNANNTQYDLTAMIGVFGGDGTDLGFQSLSFPGATEVPVALDDPCLTAPPTICVELAIYTGTFTLPARPDGYVLSYQRCCRTPTIINIEGADGLGITCTVRIPGTVVSNSSARFTEYPPIVLCLNEELVFDHSATDADGDSLVYELCTPFNGGTAFDAVPIPSPPPYAEIPWAPGYSETDQIDADPAMAIDPITGVLTVRPSLAASYTVAVRVKEYRNGQMLSETRRDFRFDVVPCLNEVTAAIAPQSVFCDGLTVGFTNSSPSGQLWWWDFGEMDMELDTSTMMSPSWTYSSPGTYVVTLVANPGLTCTDTTTSTFVVQNRPDPSFALPDTACGTQVSELVAEGSAGPDAVYLWQMGPGATPATATGPSVQVQFEAAGTSSVTLTVTENGCVGSYTGEVVVHPQPTAAFTVAPPSPQPFGTDVQLFDLSDPNGSQLDLLSWYVDGSALGTGATAQWISPLPGTYQLQLTIVSNDGCSSTAILPYVITEVPIDIPNVFTPNNDGSNDRFSILNIEQHKNELTIFNRWGMPVYQVSNYRNQWTGPDVPDGTYYYELLLRDGRVYTGHVTLLR